MSVNVFTFSILTFLTLHLAMLSILNFVNLIKKEMSNLDEDDYVMFSSTHYLYFNDIVIISHCIAMPLSFISYILQFVCSFCHVH